MFNVKRRYSKIPHLSIAIGDVFSIKYLAWQLVAHIFMITYRRMDRASTALSEGLDPTKPRTYAARSKYCKVSRTILWNRTHGRPSIEEKAKANSTSPRPKRKPVEHLLRRWNNGFPIPIKCLRSLAFINPSFLVWIYLIASWRLNFTSIANFSDVEVWWRRKQQPRHYYSWTYNASEYFLSDKRFEGKRYRRHTVARSEPTLTSSSTSSGPWSISWAALAKHFLQTDSFVSVLETFLSWLILLHLRGLFHIYLRFVHRRHQSLRQSEESVS